MSVFHEFHRILERLPKGQSRLMSDQIGASFHEFLKRKWILVDGYVSARTVSRYGLVIDEEIEVDEELGQYTFMTRNSRIKRGPYGVDEVRLYTTNLPGWLNDLRNSLDFEPGKWAKVPELIAGHLWHLGDLRVPNSSRTIPIYVACQIQSVKEEVIRALDSRVRPDCGVVFVSARERFYSPFHLPRGHQLAGLDEVFMFDGATIDREVVSRLSQPEEQPTEENFFEERSGTLLLAHLPEPRTFIGKQKKVIAHFWKHRAVESIKWSDVVHETACGKDPGSVFGSNWTDYLERHGGLKGRYRIRAPKA